MPPPMSPQGSRAGLITAVVVMSILFVTSAIFAFYYNAEYRREQMTNRTLTQTNTQLATAEVTASPEYTALVDLRNEDQYQGKSVVEILLAQRNGLSSVVAGTNDHAAAMGAVARARDAATAEDVKAAGVTKGGPLAEIVVGLSNHVREMNAEQEKLTQALTEAKDQYEKEVAQRKVVMAEQTEALEKQGKQLEEALAELASRGEAGDQSVAKIQAEADRALTATQQESSKLQKAVAERDATIADQAKKIEALQAIVARFKPVGTKENVARQIDGQIVRVPGNDNVFINLGQGDQISPGLTFEVYDRFKGVPPLGDGTTPEAEEDQLPQGKASIEVVRVGARQSECRIVRQSLGQPVIENDVIANLVYSRDMKYNFVVFGDFDLDQDKIATPGDAEVIRRLITEWGGQLQDRVNVNTDFVVLGIEPEVPTASEDESATDIARRQAAQQALDAYLDVRSQAVKLNIPIMNQNRFLAYVGYYEQSQR